MLVRGHSPSPQMKEKVKERKLEVTLLLVKLQSCGVMQMCLLLSVALAAVH